MKNKFFTFLILFLGAFIVSHTQNANEWKILYDQKETYYKIEKSNQQMFLELKIINNKYELSKDSKLHLHLEEGEYVQIPCKQITIEDNNTIVKYLIDKESKDKLKKGKIDAILIFPIKGSLINIAFDDKLIEEFNNNFK